MEFINAKEIISLSNPGVVSRQLLNPDNSSSKHLTITEGIHFGYAYNDK